MVIADVRKWDAANVTSLRCVLAGQPVNKISYITFSRLKVARETAASLEKYLRDGGSEEIRPQRTFSGHMETLDVCDDDSQAEHSLGWRDGPRTHKSLGKILEHQ